MGHEIAAMGHGLRLEPTQRCSMRTVSMCGMRAGSAEAGKSPCYLCPPGPIAVNQSRGGTPAAYGEAEPRPAGHSLVTKAGDDGGDGRASHVLGQLGSSSDPLNVKLSQGTDLVPIAAVTVAGLAVLVAGFTVWRQNVTSRTVSDNGIAAQRLQWRHSAALALQTSPPAGRRDRRQRGRSRWSLYRRATNEQEANRMVSVERAQELRRHVKDVTFRELKYIEAEFKALGFTDLADAVGNLARGSYVSILMAVIADGPDREVAKVRIAEATRRLDEVVEENRSRRSEAASKEFGER